MRPLYAIVGAAAGLLIVYLGVNVHVGLTNYDGIAAYVLSAFAGTAVALIVRFAIRKEFGPIIP